MTIHIKMLQDIAVHARAAADALQVLVDDCAEQLARNRAEENSREPSLGEPVRQQEMQPYNEPTPYDAPTAETPKITLVELRAYIAKRSNKETRPKIREILGKHGVNYLTDLPESDYEAVMKEVSAL